MSQKALVIVLSVLAAGFAFIIMDVETHAKELPTTETCPEEVQVEAKVKTWNLVIPIKKDGKQFIGMRVTGRTSVTWAPEGFNQIPGQDEHGNPEALILGYVQGPTVFQLKIPTYIKQVEVEVGIPGAGGHRFIVTQ